MASLEEIRQARLEKVNILKENGMDPYPARVERDHSNDELQRNFESFIDSKVTVVGRIMSLRGQGAIIFADLFDGTEKIQALIKEDSVSSFSLFKETVDQGDFIQVTGKCFVSKRGENTVEASDWKMVAKSLRPVPDEWYGLKDEDERYRRRYVDILLNEEVKNRFIKKSVFWNSFRTYLLDKGYVEVETPILENTPGGADARPFTTHHNAFDIDVYLRISAGELWQKELLVAGYPKVFEIGRIFRNEGVSHEHLQDYTQVEFYEAYSDYKKGMEMIKDLYRYVAEKTFGTTKFTIDGSEVDLSHDWEIYDYIEIIKEKAGIDVLEAKEGELIDKLKELSVDFDKKEINRERAVDLIWKKFRKELVGPGFLINIPLFLEPLAKRAEDERVVERFQVILGGSEMGKGFSELNNPIDQGERFQHQEELRKSGDDEAHMKNDDYVEAMEYGMPPAFGFGISERL
ncbi:MAG: lysine--tRNA ligase, partial [Candidatus Pacebacteria bacterium]|nr:lysine--tRNA ligase [Candidatus Paceibacterota bacterium]